MKETSVLHQYYNKITFSQYLEKQQHSVCLDQFNKNKSESPDYRQVINN